MYQEYKDIAEFRLVYITEAHAADGRRPTGYAKELGITEHKNYKQRCTTADMLFKDKKLTLPCLIDKMDNRVNRAYSAHPDRVFLVRTDGKLAVAGDRGPRGFSPALRDAEKWLKEFKETKKEPALDESKQADDGEQKSNSKRRRLPPQRQGGGGDGGGK